MLLKKETKLNHNLIDEIINAPPIFGHHCWVLEYADCILCTGGRIPPPRVNPGYDTKLHLEIGKVWSTPSLPLLPGPLWLGVEVPVRVLSVSWIGLFENHLYSIRQWAKNLFRNNYTKDFKMKVQGMLFPNLLAYYLFFQ